MIGKKVVDWYGREGRHLPWRDTADPYQIWIAEVIFQQTRIQQGQAYFYRFIERFPDVWALAQAAQDEVLKYWEGLGYYSRARNLHAAAKQLTEQYNGIFPEDYRELLHLKGIGPYTARAIGSFAFGNETGVLDGNVLRVMSRVLGDSSPVNEQRTRKHFQEIVDSWVDGLDSRAFNHGMMDLGATLCTPTKPDCLICPLEADCQARHRGMVDQLPVKSKRLKRKARYFHFFLARNEDAHLAIRQRPEDSFWGALWEIPNEEMTRESWEKGSYKEEALFCMEMKHVFTHFDMMIKVYELPATSLELGPEVRFITTDKISIFAFARAVSKIFEQLQVIA